MLTRINCNNPRSMYLFYTRVKRVLYRNHLHMSRRLLSQLEDLELDAENYYYCDSYLERPLLPKPPKSEKVYEAFSNKNNE